MPKLMTACGSALLSIAPTIAPTIAYAADLDATPLVDALPRLVAPSPAALNDWYVRGDVDRHWPALLDTHYITYGPPPGTDDFDSTSLDAAPSLGIGIGYRIDPHLRVDLTGDYWFKSHFRGTTSGGCGGAPCVSTDRSAFSALLLLANAYVDLGTHAGVTPYAGAGLGGARVKWDELENAISGGSAVVHPGTRSWRFAYALMAGASYCLTRNLDLDLGYRFTHVNGGRMFEYASGVGPIFDGGTDVHEARAGLRYQFGEGADCDSLHL